MSFLHKLKQKYSELKNDDESYEKELDTMAQDEDDFSSGIFINSLDEFTADDIVLNETASKKEEVSVLEIARRIMLWVFLLSFVVSFCFLISNLIAKQKGDEIYAQLENEFFSSGFSIGTLNDFLPDEGEVKYLAKDNEITTTLSITQMAEKLEAGEDLNDTSVSNEYNEELEKMRAGLASLARINPDIYGWINVEGTKINYPIVQGKDNDFYLDHAYTGDYLVVGSIFADYRNNKKIYKNYNTILYGHNVTSGSGAMFHDVTLFFQDEYFYNKKIYVYTMDGIFIYEPFSIYETRYDYNYFKAGFSSPQQFISFAEEMKSNSAKQKDMEFGKYDSMLTLSTCTNGAYYARYALHAKLIEKIVD
ncbi:MAG: class B sortase [Ruminococcaceae bacterium]|nr:class B sortase [Oscillospiraceae bacterium]